MDPIIHLGQTSADIAIQAAIAYLEKHGALSLDRCDALSAALKRLQCACNDNLNDRGKVLFAALYKQVLAGDYHYPLVYLPRQLAALAKIAATENPRHRRPSARAPGWLACRGHRRQEARHRPGPIQRAGLRL